MSATHSTWYAHHHKPGTITQPHTLIQHGRTDLALPWSSQNGLRHNVPIGTCSLRSGSCHCSRCLTVYAQRHSSMRRMSHQAVQGYDKHDKHHVLTAPANSPPKGSQTFANHICIQGLCTLRACYAQHGNAAQDDPLHDAYDCCHTA